MKCPKCNFVNPEGMLFCGKCGTKVEQICSKCNSSNPPDFSFCGKCGQALGEAPQPSPVPVAFDRAEPKSYTPKHLADKILTNRKTLEGERKLVTVMFADVAGFTALSEKLDPEDVHRIMDGCCRILVDEIHRFEGTVGVNLGSDQINPLKYQDKHSILCQLFHLKRPFSGAKRAFKPLALFQEALLLRVK